MADEKKTETKTTETKQPDPPKAAIDDDILSALGDDIVGLVNANRKKEEPPTAPDIKPVDEKKEEKTGEKKEEKKEGGDRIEQVGIKKRENVRAIAEEVVTERLEREKKTTPLPPATEEKKTVTYDESLLSPEQKEELEDAKFAESKLGKKGRSEELLKFYKSCDDYVESAKKENPDRTFDENDDEFVAFVKKNRPGWADSERETVRRARWKEEAKEEARKELAPDIEKAKRDAKEAKVMPTVERKIDEFRSLLTEATKTEDPLEREVYEEFRSAAEELATDYLRLINGVDTFGDHNSPERQQRHQWLVQFITQNGEVFAKNGGDNRIRDGKNFVSPEKYLEMQKNKDPKIANVWTFGPDDCLTMIRTHAVSVAKTAIQAEEEKAKKRGFVKQKPESTTKQTEEIKPVSGVKANTTPAPGAVQTGENQDLNHPGKELISILGLKD